MIRRCKPLCWGLLFVLICSLRAGAQVLDQVPADAMLVLKVSNLKAANDKFAKMMQQFGFAAMNPELVDPLGDFQKKMGVNAGFKADGDFAFAFFDPGDGPERQTMLILVPVTDYAAFIGNFADVKKDGDLDVVHWPNETVPMYVAHWGNYAMLSPMKEIAQKKAGGLKLHGETKKLMLDAGVDATFLVNMPAVKAKLLPMLQQSRAQAEQRLMDQFKAMGKGPEFEPLVKAMITRLFDLGESGLSDMQAVTTSVTLTQEGVNASFMYEFDPDSVAGQDVAAMKNTDGTMLNGLPDGNYVFFGGGEINPKATVKIIDDVLGPVAKAIPADTDSGKMVKELVDLMKANFGATTGQRFAMGLNPNGGNAGVISMVGSMDGDVATIMANQGKLAEDMQKINALVGQQQTLALKEKVKTVDGVDFSLIQQDMAGTPKDMQGIVAQRMFKVMYGADGMQAYFGQVNDKRMIQVVGDEDLMKAMIASAKSGDDVLGKRDEIKEIAAQLPARHCGVVYISVDQLMVSVVKIVNQQFQQNMQLQFPPNLPPWGFALSTRGSAVRVDTCVSSQLIQSVTAAVMQMYMKAAGGGGRPAGGGGGI